MYIWSSKERTEKKYYIRICWANTIRVVGSYLITAIFNCVVCEGNLIQAIRDCIWEKWLFFKCFDVKLKFAYIQHIFLSLMHMFNRFLLENNFKKLTRKYILILKKAKSLKVKFCNTVYIGSVHGSFNLIKIHLFLFVHSIIRNCVYNSFFESFLFSLDSTW